MNDIGFIGLGEMGGRMAHVLSKSVESLLVHDIDKHRVSRLLSSDTCNAANSETIAQHCSTVFLCLPDEKAVKAVIYGAQGLLNNKSKMLTTIVDCSTMDVETVKEMAMDLKTQHNIDYCDCPVSGLPARAETGELTIMFGGSKTCFDRVKPFLNDMGKQVVHCGEAGSGQMMKALNNIVYNININAVCEILPLATKAGLHSMALETVLTHASARSFAGEHFIPRILDRQFENDFSMDSAHKDLINVRKLKDQFKAEMPLFEAMQQRYEQTLTAGYGSEPKSALIKLYERCLDVLVKR